MSPIYWGIPLSNNSCIGGVCDPLDLRHFSIETRLVLIALGGWMGFVHVRFLFSAYDAMKFIAGAAS